MGPAETNIIRLIAISGGKMDIILRFSQNNSIYLERVLAIAGPGAVERHADRNGIRYTLLSPRIAWRTSFWRWNTPRIGNPRSSRWTGSTGRQTTSRGHHLLRACQGRGPSGVLPSLCQIQSLSLPGYSVDESAEHGWFRYGHLQNGALIVDKEKIARLIRRNWPGSTMISVRSSGGAKWSRSWPISRIRSNLSRIKAGNTGRTGKTVD